MIAEKGFCVRLKSCKRKVSLFNIFLIKFISVRVDLERRILERLILIVHSFVTSSEV